MSRVIYVDPHVLEQVSSEHPPWGDDSALNVSVEGVESEVKKLLTKKQKDLFKQLYIDKLTYTEIAEINGCTYNNIHCAEKYLWKRIRAIIDSAAARERLTDDLDLFDGMQRQIAIQLCNLTKAIHAWKALNISHNTYYKHIKSMQSVTGDVTEICKHLPK